MGATNNKGEQENAQQDYLFAPQKGRQSAPSGNRLLGHGNRYFFDNKHE
jgi:hypothetical protein